MAEALFFRLALPLEAEHRDEAVVFVEFSRLLDDLFPDVVRGFLFAFKA